MKAIIYIKGIPFHPLMIHVQLIFTIVYLKYQNKMFAFENLQEKIKKNYLENYELPLFCSGALYRAVNF